MATTWSCAPPTPQMESERCQALLILAPVALAGSGDRIVAALGERMAAGDPRRAHPPSPQPPVLLDRLIGVVRARRIVAARRWKDLREGLLVTAYQQEN